MDESWNLVAKNSFPLADQHIILKFLFLEKFTGAEAREKLKKHQGDDELGKTQLYGLIRSL